MEHMFQVIISFSTTSSFLLIPYTRADFHYPQMFGWVMKHLYRVKCLQISYRIQGTYFTTPKLFGWVMKRLYRIYLKL